LNPRFRSVSFGLAVLTALLPSGCATLQQLVALRNVEFSLDRVSNVRLAGIDLGGMRSIDDLRLADAGLLALAVSREDVPLELQLHLLAENPAENGTDARLVRMDWTLLLQGRETLTGVFAENMVLPAGQPTEVPIAVRLNLVEFFEENAQDLLELALSLSGQGGAPKNLALRATPVVDTPLGPMRYPEPITIVSREVGSGSAAPAQPDSSTRTPKTP